MQAVQVPVDLLHWILATLSIVALLIFLVPLRWRAPEAGPMAMFTAAIVALLAFRTPWETLAVASAKGVWDAIFILYVIWPALLLYQITKQAGAYDALRQGIARFSRNELFIILALSWVFASFLQGIAGFGAPVAVVVPLLLAMGVKPVYAVAMGVVAHAWARFFGTLGVGWLATLQVANLQDVVRAAYEASLLILIPTYLGGLFVVWLYGKGPAVRHAWPLVLILGTILGVGQLLVAVFISPELSTFLGAAVALLALYPLSRWRRFGEPIQGIPERPAMVANPGERTERCGAGHEPHDVVPALHRPDGGDTERPVDSAAQRSATSGADRTAIPGGRNRLRRPECRGRKLRARYGIHTSWNDAVDHGHHHLVCVQCGRLLPRLGGAS